jgi:KEOPS complex subunit Cgi121
MIKIVGAKGNITDIDKFLKQVVSFAQSNKIMIQTFNADLIYGENHIISAVEHAIRAMNQKTNTTNSLEMEILLYASGERQLKLAIPKMGVKKGKANIVLVLIKDTNGKISDRMIGELLELLSFNRDDEVIEGDESKLKKFGISKDEMKTVTKAKYGDLILEKVAMVDIIK